MEAMVVTIVRTLVDHPDAVSVEALKEIDGVTYEIHVAPGDVGKVIGRGGRIIQALRAVVRAAAATRDQRANVEVAS